MEDLRIRQQELLKEAYFAEIDTALSYTMICHTVTGIHGAILRSLIEDDIQEEFCHAQKIADRIDTLGFMVPSTEEYHRHDLSEGQILMSHINQYTTAKDCATYIVKAEHEAITLYKEIIRVSEEIEDYTTADLITELLADEEDHARKMSKLL